jgi:hypothetical protein
MVVSASSSWFPSRYGDNSSVPFRLRVATLNGFGPIYTFCELAQFPRTAPPLYFKEALILFFAWFAYEI